MTADDLVANLAGDCGQPRDIVTDFLQALADLVEAELAAGRSASLPGLGTLTPFDTLGRAHDVRIAWQSAAPLKSRVTEAHRARGLQTAGGPGARPAGAASVPEVAAPLIGVPRGVHHGPRHPAGRGTGVKVSGVGCQVSGAKGSGSGGRR